MSGRQTRVDAIIREATFMTKPSLKVRPVSGLSVELSPPPRFARKSPGSGLNPSYYSTRSGILNATQPQVAGKLGGNNYIHILKLKKSRSVKRTDPTFTEPSSLLSAKSASLLSSLVTSPKGSPQRVFALPRSFETSAIECRCEDALPCSCGKRDLTTPPAKWLEDLTAKCTLMSLATKTCKQQLHSQSKYVRERLQLYTRETELALRSQRREASFLVRKRMHEVSRRLLANEFV